MKQVRFKVSPSKRGGNLAVFTLVETAKKVVDVSRVSRNVKEEDGSKVERPHVCFTLEGGQKLLIDMRELGGISIRKNGQSIEIGAAFTEGTTLVLPQSGMLKTIPIDGASGPRKDDPSKSWQVHSVDWNIDSSEFKAPVEEAELV